MAPALALEKARRFRRIGGSRIAAVTAATAATACGGCRYPVYFAVDLGRSSRWLEVAQWGAFLFAFGARSAAAEEDATKSACLRAYESSQLHRRNQELLAARQDLRTCASEACPAVARTDCVPWLAEVDAAIPSVVFEATGTSGPVFDVSVKIDGAVRATELDGRAVELDPGLHTFTFERAGAPPIDQKLIVRPTEKNRLVSANFAPSPKPLAAQQEIPQERSIPLAVYLTAGIGLVGLADFAVVGALGLSKKQDIESTGCAPFCSSQDVNGVKTRYAIADIGLAIGVGALVTSGILFLVRPSRPAPRTSGASLVVEPTRSGGVVGGRFDF